MNCFIILAVLVPMLGGAACYYIGTRNKTARDFFAMAVSACVLAFALLLGGSFELPGVLGMGLYFQVSPMQKVLSVLAAVIWVGSEVFSRDYLAHAKGRNRYHLFSLITLGATQGVFLSGDLFTTFVFFEIMSFTSYVTVKQTQDHKAIRAGQTYLAIAVGCGMATLTGLFMLYCKIGTLRFDEMFDAAAAVGDRNAIFAAAVLILVGFGAKAGMFPVHVWLPDTHPAAPAPFSAILSCILTKTGVFGALVVSCKLMRFDADWGMLVTVLGTITMALGAVLGLSAAVMPIFGLLPDLTLGQIGTISQPFMGGHGEANGVNYFSAVNIVGGLKSIIIGVLVYLVVVRKLLMRNGEYVNVLPKWLSLENGVYRPLVTKVLPGIGLVLARIPNSLADGCVAIMGKCIFNQDGKRVDVKENGYFGKYSDEPFLRKGFTDTLAFSFLLLGICVVGALIYIMCQAI